MVLNLLIRQERKMSIDWTVTSEEMELICKILSRAKEKSIKEDFDFDWMSSSMDLSATNANGCPMDFKAMLEADDFNFFHDFHGIQRHINRRTGKLENFFLPRFAKKQE
jgi:hypothetical protein